MKISSVVNLFFIVGVSHCDDTNFSSKESQSPQNPSTNESTEQEDAVEPVVPIEIDREGPPLSPGGPSVVSEKYGCNVHFSGVLLSGAAPEENGSIRELFRDLYSAEIIGAGTYPIMREGVPNASEGSLDGLAVAPGVRLTIYSEPNLKGSRTLDILGPAVIFTSSVVDSDLRGFKPVDDLTATWDTPYEQDFPPKVRMFSSSRMDHWPNNSSMEISCE